MELQDDGNSSVTFEVTPGEIPSYIAIDDVEISQDACSAGNVFLLYYTGHGYFYGISLGTVAFIGISLGMVVFIVFHWGWLF